MNPDHARRKVATGHENSNRTHACGIEECMMTRTQKAKALFCFAAFLSFVVSVFLWFRVDKDYGLFVGIWVPSILSLGALLLTGERGRR